MKDHFILLRVTLNLSNPIYVLYNKIPDPQSHYHTIQIITTCINVVTNWNIKHIICSPLIAKCLDAIRYASNRRLLLSSSNMILF